ncbi:MAG TPA: hypothetical protein DCE18_03865, partial [Syntrophobacteraceae bacterium]|nr:hypothetical protein [Syntrophobacteraceae bacterium]
MDLNIHKLRMEAARIAARHRRPAFYLQFQAPLAMARGLYHSNPLVKELRDLVGSRLSEDLGHGLFHSTRVSIESAALIFVEAEGQQLPPEHIQRLMVLGQLAGLLHDICRGEDNHASAGALEAARVLVSFPLSGEETQSICCAIANHEAFVQPVPCGLP